ncbi:MAG: pseudouridine synthase [Agarilytica sp.]
MSNLLLLNKPFNVLSQFTDDANRKTLSDFIDTKRYPGFYAAGRLDYDSEGLLLLTNNGQLQHRISNPQNKMEKTYWVQVEGEIDEASCSQLESGVELKDGVTLPAKARPITTPTLWDRYPPIRERKNQPTSWLQLTISEGKNRQVRRMTAAVGYPTLRLIRTSIGPWQLAGLLPGETHEEQVHAPKQKNTKKRLYKKK